MLSLCLFPGCFNPIENEAQDLSYVYAAIQYFHKGKIHTFIRAGPFLAIWLSSELRFSLSQERLDGDLPHFNKVLELFVNMI